MLNHPYPVLNMVEHLGGGLGAVGLSVPPQIFKMTTSCTCRLLLLLLPLVSCWTFAVSSGLLTLDRGDSFLTMVRRGGIEVREVAVLQRGTSFGGVARFDAETIQALQGNSREHYREIGQRAATVQGDGIHSASQKLAAEPHPMLTYDHPAFTVGAVALLREAAVDETGLVCDRSHRCIHANGCPDPQRAPGRKMLHSEVWQRTMRRADFPASRVPMVQDLVVLTQRWGADYFHFIWEALVRLAPVLELGLLTQSKTPLNFHVASTTPPFVREILAEFGIEEHHVVDGPYRTQRLWLPEPTACGTPSFSQVRRLQLLVRTSILAGIPALLPLGLPGSASRRAQELGTIVLVKRTNSQARRLLNWFTLHSMLEVTGLERDIEVVTFDDAKLPTARATFKIFGRARIVVGAHGAGLANIVACSPAGIYFS